MVSPPPFLVDDQTDEDFFNNLIEDDLRAPGSGSGHASIERALSDLSIGDDGVVLDDSTPGDSGIATREENHAENSVACPLSGFQEVKAVSVESNTTPASTGSFDSDVEFKTLESNEQPVVQVSAPLSAPVANGATLETTSEVESSAGNGGGTKGTPVKEVTWSAFRVDSEQFDSDGFGSGVDFSSEKAAKYDNKLQADIGQSSSCMEYLTADESSYLDSSQQQDAQCNSSAIEQVADVNNSQYWENLYPGWKFDVNTGQWYQINDHDTTAAVATTEAENINASKEEQLDQDLNFSPSNEIRMDQRSEISYSQLSANSVVEAIAEDISTGYVSNWNQDSFSSSEYPPNMVFDPQYPGWYYDTNTQQWHTLESYTQTVQATTSTTNGQINQEIPFSNGLVEEDSILNNEVGQFEQNISVTHYSKVMGIHQDNPRSMFVQDNVQQPEPMTRLPDSSENQQKNFYNTTSHAAYVMNGQVDHRNLEPVSIPDYGYSNGTTGLMSFVPPENMGHINQPKVVQSFQEFSSHGLYDNQNLMNHPQQPMHQANPSYSNFSHALNEGRSSAGRPPHALVTFGFGGKLIVMRDATCSGANLDYANKDSAGGTISVLGLMDILTKETDDSSTKDIKYSYFHSLCQQSFPGPLVGGNASAKDVSKWIDDRITHYQSPVADASRGDLPRLLSLLKILSQHYGKLRSPYSSDPSFEDVDGPGSAVTNLFSSVSKNGVSPVQYASSSGCMQSLPTEGEMEETAIMVQKLLVSGRRREALQCAQVGKLWGLALVLAAQLGEKFYVETVKQMANRQFVSGSPLRTLCLLTAGQPADVFSSEISSNSAYPATENAQRQSQVLSSGILDEWEKHLAIITSNRTKDDELVIIHLGDSVWREKGEISAAHICYLVAEANFESYSDSARMCLLGADHWKCPRTYASPDAIQRTELYEYSKVLGNSQFILFPFQPYKLVYAYMLAEVGKVSDSLRYCQAASKLLKSSSRTPGTETLKALFLSLEERLRMHQQGGYNTNLDPAKLVGKLFTSIDRSIHRMIGTAPLPSTPMPQSNEKEDNFVAPKVVNSQSTMAMSSLIPSGSAESISDWANNSKNMMQNRSVSEPDFGKALKQEKTIDTPDSESKSASRLGRFGSQIFQRTVGWVSRSRSDHQAKLGESNKFYYDEKLKRWVEEGAERQSDEPPLPPPPTTASFQNGILANNTEKTLTKSSTDSANGVSEITSPTPPQQASQIPPVSPSPSQFSARNRMGVRSRYVDTFKKGGGSFTNSFKPPSTQFANPAAVGGNFFVPGRPATFEENTADTAGISTSDSLLAAESSAIVGRAAPLSPRSQSIPSDLQYFPGTRSNAFSNYGTSTTMEQSNNGSSHALSRPASWSGNSNTMFTPTTASVSFPKQGLPVPSPTDSSSLHLDSSNSQLGCENMGEGLDDIAL